MAMMNVILTELIKRPHPAIVHFSMALYPISAFFAILFRILDNPGLLQSAYWCFLLAGLMLLPIAFTGFLDFIRLKAHSKTAHRLLQAHLINGLALTVLGIFSALFFLWRPPDRNPDLFPLFLGTSLLFSIMGITQGILASLMIYRHKVGVDQETR